ncbi:uncharacterized protein ColSpa_11416 [Colletotrichum spaethianum]|uniref:Uncharacterized protein n=1 Tax=Colletotrichum spaethianum TaxID=700344 RepID=A0AA37PFR0_9PEZI|nr:uncharacterized protein ColSpa_11416 [Colletotrichum spaethianum]GKT51235.1 hypothetical protein ColSpa_11416 [Colletotrichum spaethianum]
MASRHVAKPTFFLSDLSTMRDGHIVLGNIFTDPFQVDDKVAGPLSKVGPGDIPAGATQSVTETGLYLRETQASSWGASLLAKFLSIFHISVGADRGRDLEVVYEVANLETVTLSSVGPYIRQRIARPSEAALQKELLMGFSPSLYMVTGIKYSKGLKVWTIAGSSTEGGAELGGAVSPDASASASAGVHGARAASRSLARTIEGEIVLAYQLTKITPKKIKTVDGTFLSDNGNKEKIDVEIEGEFGLEGMEKAAVDGGLDPSSDLGINSVWVEGGSEGHNYSRVFAFLD